MLRENIVVGFVRSPQQGPMKLHGEHAGHLMFLRRPLGEGMDGVDQIRSPAQRRHGRIPIARVGADRQPISKLQGESARRAVVDPFFDDEPRRPVEPARNDGSL